MPDALRTIVVPTDCSEISQRALHYADRMATRTGASIIAVYGHEISARVDGEGVAGVLASRHDVESMMLPMRRCVEETVAVALSTSTRHDIVIADALPADAIIDVAEKRDADLIVIGTRDRNRLLRAILGSVTDAVLQRSSRPVLILREHTTLLRGDPISRILCPFRDSEPSFAAVREAARIAQLFGAEVQFVHAMEEERTPLPERFREIAGPAPLRTVRITSDVGARVVALAQELRADLIVLGTAHRRFSDPTMLGRPSSEIVRTAHCPVLAVCG